MTANRQVGKAYLFFKSKGKSPSIKSSVRRIQGMHPLVDIYLPEKTLLVRGDEEFLNLCEKMDSKGFNRTLKIILRERGNFDAMAETLIILDSMIKLNIIGEGEFAFLTYKSRARTKRKYTKLQIAIPSQPRSA